MDRGRPELAHPAEERAVLVDDPGAQELLASDRIETGGGQSRQDERGGGQGRAVFPGPGEAVAAADEIREYLDFARPSVSDHEGEEALELLRQRFAADFEVALEQGRLVSAPQTVTVEPGPRSDEPGTGPGILHDGRTGAVHAWERGGRDPGGLEGRARGS